MNIDIFFLAFTLEFVFHKKNFTFQYYKTSVSQQNWFLKNYFGKVVHIFMMKFNLK